MSETKFSPGPYQKFIDADENLLIADANGEPVFLVVETFDAPDDPDADDDAPDILIHSTERIFANEALGLAAPDLYAVAERIAEALRVCREYSGGFLNSDDEELEGMALAALAKARGEATE